MIRPIIEYGSLLYNNCSLHDSNRIEGVQRKAALLCTGAIRRTESKKLMTELNWDSLAQRRAYVKLCVLYKICKNFSPHYLGRKYLVTSTSARASRLNTAASHRLFEPLCRLSCYQSSLFPSTIKLWNALPSGVAETSSIMMFKIAIRTHLMLATSETKIGSYKLLSTGRLGITLTQLRLGLSPLNHHLFTYNIADNPFCSSCGSVFEFETTVHYFCTCRNYDVERALLRNNITCLLSNLSLSCSVDFDIENDVSYTALLLNGFSSLNVSFITADNATSIEAKFNSQLYNHVIRFMYNTARFAPRCV